MTESLKLYRTTGGIFVEQGDIWFALHFAENWEALLCRDNLHSYLIGIISSLKSATAPDPNTWLAPIAEQEVWAAGVTYFRSRTARMEESEHNTAKNFYDLVYNAERPELFFKATPNRVVGPGGAVRIRQDSRWNIPEPELALLLTPKGNIVGYTIGNDISSRDIEGENPLYLPQAKVYDRCCGLGPCILVQDDPLPGETTIRLTIKRAGAVIFEGQTKLADMKRSLLSLVQYLFRDNVFPKGAILLTGTGIVPDAPITLECGDESYIAIAGIGALTNRVICRE
jgi:2-dehydro-3-deoxy-D-arabinonate dehydratase